MKISQSWKFTRPFMTSFANEDIGLHIPRSGIIGVQSNRKVNAIEMLQFYQQNYDSKIIDLTPLREVSTQRKMQLLQALPLEEQNLDLTSDDAIKNMQIEYEKSGTRFVFGYPNTIEDAKKLENYYGGLNLFINLNFGESFNQDNIQNKYVIDENGIVLNKELYLKMQSLGLDYLDQNTSTQQSDLDIPKYDLNQQESFTELSEFSDNQNIQKLDNKKVSSIQESLLDFYDKRGVLININIKKSEDLKKAYIQLTDNMVRKFKY